MGCHQGDLIGRIFSNGAIAFLEQLFGGGKLQKKRIFGHGYFMTNKSRHLLCG
jgi:hypothetical protein